MSSKYKVMLNFKFNVYSLIYSHNYHEMIINKRVNSEKNRNIWLIYSKLENHWRGQYPAGKNVEQIIQIKKRHFEPLWVCTVFTQKE